MNVKTSLRPTQKTFLGTFLLSGHRFKYTFVLFKCPLLLENLAFFDEISQKLSLDEFLPLENGCQLVLGWITKSKGLGVQPSCLWI